MQSGKKVELVQFIPQCFTSKEAHGIKYNLREQNVFDLSLYQ